MNPQELGELASKLMSPNERAFIQEGIDTTNLYITFENPDDVPQMVYNWISPYLQSYMVGLMRLVLRSQDTTSYIEKPIIDCKFKDLPEFKLWVKRRWKTHSLNHEEW
jgi:hypothetical protein